MDQLASQASRYEHVIEFNSDSTYVPIPFNHSCLEVLLKLWVSFLFQGREEEIWLKHVEKQVRLEQGYVLPGNFALANLANTKWYKKPLKMNRNPCIWVLWVVIWEYSVRTIQWMPTWQGLDVFQKSFCLCALDESSLSNRMVNLSTASFNQLYQNVNTITHQHYTQLNSPTTSKEIACQADLNHSSISKQVSKWAS